jgi:hypothetical protein
MEVNCTKTAVFSATFTGNFLHCRKNAQRRTLRLESKLSPSSCETNQVCCLNIFMITENVLVNAADITEVHSLSKLYVKLFPSLGNKYDTFIETDSSFS